MGGTGSVAVGRKVAESAAATLKRVNLELGGKTPMIVFDEPDLDRAIPLLARGITTFGGQFCMTGSRVLVAQGVAAQIRRPAHRAAGPGPIVREEVFGPVATFEVFSDESDAIGRANATDLGLAAAVFTRDGDRARRVSREIQAGTVWTNAWAVLDDAFPEGATSRAVSAGCAARSP
jgi:acyl-CoA reductase-like NAD-dependent aldehyde dehydrogenase